MRNRMNENPHHSLTSMSTEELLKIWTQTDPEGDSAESLGIVRDTLMVRGGIFRS